MSRPDLNLLVTLDVLLAEGGVARAARRLGLSPSATSRALARLREVTGDPLLVRAGRGLVATPRALELRALVPSLVEQAEAALRPVRTLDLARLSRTFTIRTRDGFVETFGPALMARFAAEAPGARLCFLRRQDGDSLALRDSDVDLETAVVKDATSPDIRAQALFRDRYVGVVRPEHGLATGRMTAQRYAADRHVSVLRLGSETGPVDDALSPLGLGRQIVAVVGDFAGALALARASDLVATVPERHTARLREGLHSFDLPFAVPAMTVSMLWHPRLDADLAHRWMRGCVRDVCRTA